MQSTPANRQRFTFKKIFFWLILLGPGLLFLFCSACFLIYIYWPSRLANLDFPPLDPEAEHLILLAHGVNSSPEEWSNELAQSLSNVETAETQIVSLDWNPYAENPFRCSTQGKRIGHRIATSLIASEKLTSVHLIAHSCGAFVITGICETLQEQRQDINIQTTFLDPVAVYGGLFWRYGIRVFGQCGDFSEAYINSDDNVPGSNEMLPNAHTFDITRAKDNADYTGSGHNWPTRYYQILAEEQNILQLRDDQSLQLKYPPGELQFQSD